MAKKDKTEKLLNAIKKHSDEQRQILLNNIACEKEEALNKVEINSKKKADKYILKQINIATNNIKSEYAVKNLQAQGNLFKARDNMLTELFKKVSDKLKDYTKTYEYKEKLITYAEEIANYFDGNDCVIYLKSEDMQFADEILKLFTTDSVVKIDTTIEIGGIKGYCKKFGYIADNTLDSKLSEEKANFLENSDLKLN